MVTLAAMLFCFNLNVTASFPVLSATAAIFPKNYQREEQRKEIKSNWITSGLKKAVQETPFGHVLPTLTDLGEMNLLKCPM
jgi:hypothetical protein